MTGLTRLLALYHRSGLRGSTRLFDLLSHRMPSLQNTVVAVDGGMLHVDLRISSARGILAEPYAESGEGLVMKRFVRPGDNVFDIGAHFGFYTLLLRRLVGDQGKVFAFEPNPELLASLRRTLEPLGNVELFEMGLSNDPGELELHIPEDPSMASISDWTAGIAGKVHSLPCRFERMDELVGSGRLPVPDFIKCDVEGAELSVFQSGERTIDRPDAPVILFEVNRQAAAAFGYAADDAISFLKGLKQPRYQFFEVRTDAIVPVSSGDLEYSNILAVPETKNERDTDRAAS